MTDAERDAIREYIVRTIDGAVSKAITAIDVSALRGKDGERGKSVAVTFSADAPAQRKAGDIWIVP